MVRVAIQHFLKNPVKSMVYRQSKAVFTNSMRPDHINRHCLLLLIFQTQLGANPIFEIKTFYSLKFADIISNDDKPFGLRVRRNQHIHSSNRGSLPS